MDETAQIYIDKFYKHNPDRKILFLVTAGSHFFNLNSPNSDKDYRGIYLPSPKEYYEGEGKRKMISYRTNESSSGSKNSSEDVDFDLFSLTKFLELLKKGDFNCQELLHAPNDKILIDSPDIQSLRDLKQLLLVNDVSAFLGFINKEYKRYGVNAKHYGQQKEFVDFLKQYDNNIKLCQIWSDIKEFAKDKPHIIFTESQTGKKRYVPSIKIAQRLHQNTVRVGYIIDAIERVLENYGHRQKACAETGVEYKGLYHAQRLIYEANDLFDHGEFIIPFTPERLKWMQSIKDGQVGKEELFSALDEQIDALYKREKEATPNRRGVENFIDRVLFQIDGKYKIKHVRERKQVV